VGTKQGLVVAATSKPCIPGRLFNSQAQHRTSKTRPSTAISVVCPADRRCRVQRRHRRRRSMSAPSRPGPNELRSTWPQRAWTLAGTASIISSFLTCIRLLAASGCSTTELLAGDGLFVADGEHQLALTDGAH